MRRGREGRASRAVDGHAASSAGIRSDDHAGGGEQPVLGERRAEQGDADRPPVRRGAGRDGDGGEVEQVGELRVAAEDEVAGHRLLGELGAGERGRARSAAAATSTRSTAARSHAARSSCSRCRARKASTAVKSRPRSITARVTGSTSSGCVGEEPARARRAARPPTGRRRAGRRPRPAAPTGTCTVDAAAAAARPATAANAAAIAVSPAKSSPSASASRQPAPATVDGARPVRVTTGRPGPARRAPRAPRAASATSRVNTLTQSSDRQAGTTPLVPTSPRVGFSPTIPFSAAGTRPEPAVSVPRAKATMPAATATALPELDPPEIRSPPKTLSGAPYGERVPLRPVANWSRLVLPTTIAPGGEQPRDAAGVACRACSANAGQAAVVGRPATSMLSLTANGHPVERQVGRRSAAPARRPGRASRGLDERDPGRVAAPLGEPVEHGVDDVVRARAVAAEAGDAGQGCERPCGSTSSIVDGLVSGEDLPR